ncbi:hypothetical protein EHQ81_13510 [Leptospira selangorensis]|uniref:Uncharacterized protein n=1 Tax=Leptospira selangorensis TaxID=2484982 RepID=A0A5F2C2M5_9LEPT|nr:hypothetical protein [Leptospira selangorensis]TGM12552.1 hypothetical protein EHQ81_13510 [Leptospira selangorensis]TGM20176.1 hypothetical protein EHQ82_10875 [Leptospira selangorensis]
MKNTRIAIICLVLLAEFLSFCGIDKSKNSIGNPLPVLVLIEEPGFRSNIIPTSPQFILYDDGSVIYTKRKNEYQYAKISKDVFKELIPRDSFKSLKDYYDASDTTDLGSTSIKYLEDGNTYFVNVYADLQFENDRKRVPEDFLLTYDKILKQSENNGNLWIPNSIEIRFFGVSGSFKNPIKWPTKIPFVVKNKMDGTQVIYVEGKNCSEFIEFARKFKKGQVISFYGNTLSLHYRYIFPYEEMWMK